MDACPTWKTDHPVATYVGSANQGLGFYHVEIPDVQSTQWLNLTNCGVVRVITGEISLAELEGKISMTRIGLGKLGSWRKGIFW